MRVFLATGAILAGLSVAAGAFASHALRDKLTQRAIEIFETAARYQMYHALALLLVAVLLSQAGAPVTMLVAAGTAFILGIVIFSGSLYVLSLTDVKWLGAITPFGGVALMAGWACLAIAAWNQNWKIDL